MEGGRHAGGGAMTVGAANAPEKHLRIAWIPAELHNVHQVRGAY